MRSEPRIGVLAYQGDVAEHIEATSQAARRLKLAVQVVEVRDKGDLAGVTALVIPGGESTTLYKLCEREGMIDELRGIKSIFGTCAGAIMLAKSILGSAPGQKTLALMDVQVDRNAFGRQGDSFETEISTLLGKTSAVFIRAPRFVKTGTNVHVLARLNDEVIACEETSGDHYYLALSFHPELTSTLFHEYFLKKIATNNLH